MTTLRNLNTASLTLEKVLAVFPEYEQFVEAENREHTDPEWFLFLQLLEDGKIEYEIDPDREFNEAEPVQSAWQDFDPWLWIPKDSEVS